ncbi:hypothetical protein VTP01DRAFT_4345 [Rhizomucor pusillus]|uniref:uncharacterized protein n=1 Tax=Rhizomucor pusillus TaxID=4840 RepID=UPI0037429114
MSLAASNHLYFIYILRFALSIRHVDAQDDGSDYDSGDDGDSSSDDSGDDCSLISSHTCNPNGICKYCAMCLESSCILSKSTTPSEASAQAACNTTQFGADVYDWYGYCLSSGNDSDGDYCATSVECYQYRKNANASVSYIWQNLKCDPNSCLLVTDRGTPPPAPGQLPPLGGSSNGTNGHGSSTDSKDGDGERHHEHSELDFADHSPTAIALTVTCTFIFLVGVVWLMRLWLRSRYAPLIAQKRPFSWLAGASTRPRSNDSDSSRVPSTAPPSFSSEPEMTSTRSNGVVRRIFSSSLRSGQSSHGSQSGSINNQEPLPAYNSPDPSPPKYEQAIVTQIRGLHDPASQEPDDQQGHGALPPPLWLPIYFTPNHSAYSFGRLRRHPPPHLQSSAEGASSSSAPSPSQSLFQNQSTLWHHSNDLADPFRAFWYHHQQLQQQHHIQLQPSTSSPASTSSRQAPEHLHSRPNARQPNNQSTENLEEGNGHQ